MKSIAQVANQELVWSQSNALRTKHELRAGTEVVGTITFDRATLATGAVEGAHWTFKREGFWRQQVTVRPEGSDDNVAVFRPHALGGGELRTTDGKQLDLETSHFWHQEWTWAEDDRVLVRFKADGHVEIAAEASQRAELALLVVLGWYLILLAQKDVVRAAQAATSATSVVVMH